MIRRTFATLATFSLLMLLPLTAVADDDQATLARLRSEAAKLETLSSDFVQEKYLEIFNDVLTAHGRFYYRRPDALRWELLDPVKTGFVLNGEDGQRWHERSGNQESFTIARDPVMNIVARELLAWTRVDLDELVTRYTIRVENHDPIRLHLTPLTDTAGFLEYLLIEFAPQAGHVRLVEVHEPGGDYTRIRFTNTRINEPLAKELF